MWAFGSRGGENVHECQSSARLAKFGKGQDSGEKEDGTRSKCVRVKGRVA